MERSRSLASFSVYHRIYDVTLLITALAWALAALDGPRKTGARVLLVPMMLFIIPFDVSEAISRRRVHFMALTQTRWWQSIVAPDYAWGLLAVTITLLTILSCSPIESHQTVALNESER